ncbi:unnamed protein product [Thelazia callipaeda]|uniref:Ovule protein n=1 Tax=Thelazia callipaeda TaxID=103827 RepID=A0A0N5CVQ1_THECL|nr:unnamed protein product [Thelazia callipaeda]
MRNASMNQFEGVVNIREPCAVGQYSSVNEGSVGSHEVRTNIRLDKYEDCMESCEDSPSASAFLSLSSRMSCDGNNCGSVNNVDDSARDDNYNDSRSLFCDSIKESDIWLRACDRHSLLVGYETTASATSTTTGLGPPLITNNKILLSCKCSDLQRSERDSIKISCEAENNCSTRRKHRRKPDGSF